MTITTHSNQNRNKLLFIQLLTLHGLSYNNKREKSEFIFFFTNTTVYSDYFKQSLYFWWFFIKISQNEINVHHCLRSFLNWKVFWQYFFWKLDLMPLFIVYFKNLERFSLQTPASCLRKTSGVRRSEWTDQTDVTEELLSNGRRWT